MKRIVLLPVLVVAMIACSCSNKENTSPIDVDQSESGSFSPIELSETEAVMCSTVNDFGIEIFKSLYKNDSHVFSPLSVSMAFSMAAMGADGETYDQMCSTLGFAGFSRSQIGSFYEKIMHGISGIDENAELDVANSVWVHNVFPILDSYKNDVTGFFHSGAFNLDFSDKANAKNKINSWVSENTGKRIPSLIDELDGSTLIMLANAICFNGKWSVPFKMGNVLCPFVDMDGHETWGYMMEASFSGNYGKVQGYELVEIPYGNGAFVMDVILPSEDLSFSDAVQSFDKGVYESLTKSQKCVVNMKMPAFKIAGNFELVDAMASMGMMLPFSENANFSKMSSTPIKLGNAIHKAYVEVNEKGTVASSATGTLGNLAASLPPKSIDIVVNRPFIFVIREKSTDTILIIGQKVR